MDWIEALVIPFVKVLFFIFALLGAGAYMTLFERKVCSRFQVRYGPNRAGPFGIFQPLADAIKAFFKEEIVPNTVDKLTYLIAPGISLAAVLITFGVVPVGPSINLFGYEVSLQIADVNVGALYLLAVAGLGTYGIVLGGWSSNNKYSLLGAFRTTAQLISYELPLGLALVSVVLIAGSLSLKDIVQFQGWVPLVVLQPIGFLIYLICGLAENNRSPFDLPETENELVSGFATEYGGIKFAIFFIAEYTNMVVVSSILATLYLGGWRWPAFLADIHPVVAVALFGVKVLFFLYLFVWIRASLPRVRYDKLMRFSWKFLFPLSLVNLAATAVVVALVV
ncbi:MAG: NADH-quinone oxidoreductase subunit NuoH [Anaerolineae bacterium]